MASKHSEPWVSDNDKSREQLLEDMEYKTPLLKICATCANVHLDFTRDGTAYNCKFLPNLEPGDRAYGAHCAGTVSSTGTCKLHEWNIDTIKKEDLPIEQSEVQKPAPPDSPVNIEAFPPSFLRVLKILEKNGFEYSIEKKQGWGNVAVFRSHDRKYLCRQVRESGNLDVYVYSSEYKCIHSTLEIN